MFFQFNNFQFKVLSVAVLIKLDSAGETIDVGHLHVVDQRVAMLPGILSVAAQRTHVDNLENISVKKNKGSNLVYK